MIDLALTDDMATRYRVVMDNDGDDEVGELLADDRTLLGLSDAGAHASQLCDACYSTHLLGHWVRERKALSLEEAVWRLTGHPHAPSASQTGAVQAGFHADLVAFDPDTVGTAPVHGSTTSREGPIGCSSAAPASNSSGSTASRTCGDGEELAGVAPGRLVRS